MCTPAVLVFSATGIKQKYSGSASLDVVCRLVVTRWLLEIRTAYEGNNEAQHAAACRNLRLPSCGGVIRGYTTPWGRSRTSSTLSKLV